MKKRFYTLWENLIRASGFCSTLLVLSISFYLFREAYGLFRNSGVESGYSIFVHQSNPIQEFEPDTLRKIFNKDVRRWSEIGGIDERIEIFSLSDLEKKFKEEALGPDLQFVPEKVWEYSENKPAIIGYFPSKLLDSRHKTVAVRQIEFSDLVFGDSWFPASSPIASFGAASILLGSLWVSFGAILFAMPMGLVVAIYLAEIANPRMREISLHFIELLAGIPSVVFGFFGLVLVVPLLKDIFNLDQGESALAGSIILGIISLPTIISITQDAFLTIPKDIKASSLSLGATELQTIFFVLIPYAKSAIFAAMILGIGRAFGETMAVLMVTGNAAIIPESFFQPVRTITATIASELGEAPNGGIHYEALFVLGTILFVFTFLLNLIANFFVGKKS